MAANGSRRRNHGWRKKHGRGVGGNGGGKIEGQRENEMGNGTGEREDKKGPGVDTAEATEEKTRLHVTSSPEPI